VAKNDIWGSCGQGKSRVMYV